MSFPYKRILCPVDFDATSATAMKEAGAIAQLCKGKVCVLHVVWINPLATEGYVLAELQESQSESARTKIAEVASSVLAGVDYEIRIEVGDAGETILAMETRLPADLVVMATHGRHGVTRLVMGSVAERVVRESTVPVLTIRTPTH
jgi:nucleotide-binding universal stress UspA family protein